MGEKRLYLGLDMGSVSLDTVVIDDQGNVVLADYRRIKGRPLATALTVLTELFKEYPRENFSACAVTGSGAATLGPLLNATPINEIIALTRSVSATHPEARTIIDMGGEDAKLILVVPDGRGGLRIEDFAMNTMCAAGTGSFLDQQAHRLGLTIEEFSRLALKSTHPPRLAGRCSVFAKSDMIHLQQEATPDYDIVAGLCFAVARNLKSNIAKGKSVVAPVCFTGGVAANEGVRRGLIEVFGLKPSELIIPQHFGCMGAMGAALVAMDRAIARPIPTLDRLELQANQLSTDAPRLPRLTLSEHHRTPAPQLVVPKGKIQGYLGVDVGSISTNVVVIDPEGNVLSKQYLMTAGRPLEAVKEGLRRVHAELGDDVEILGAGTTGSGRYLTGDFIGADIVRNEITAQATAAAFIDPEVDTIFEIGGQDSKYISLENGAIVDFTMNKVCAAGTGSFLEEQAEKLGINIKEEFARLALASTSPIRLGERCTVFMESDLVAHQGAGAKLEDLVAGLCYSIVYNYLNKVVEDRRVGDRIFYQGGTAANKGIVAAFESVLGKPIVVPPHHEVTGAIGVALLAMRERTWSKSRFKGFEVSQTSYKITTFECGGCPNACSVRKVVVEGEKRPLFYGARCERYEKDSPRTAKVKALPDLFAEREQMLTDYITPVPLRRKRGVVGVPRCMFIRELLPFFSAFLARLGFEVVLSPVTNKTLIHKGVEVVVNEPCFPVKVAYGHLGWLLEQGIDKILLPSLINLPAPGHPLGYGVVCPYAQSLCYTAPAALPALEDRLVTGPVRMGLGKNILRDDLLNLAEALGGRGWDLKPAMDAGLEAQQDFYRRMESRGRQILEELKERNQAMVVVSRPYNGADPGINLGLPEKMRRLGVIAIPMDMLPLDSQMGHPELEGMYWRYGQKILAAGLITRADDRLNAVYITNFGCGPDSFIGHFFRKIMAGKPFLEIEIDEHSADVGAITRLEAFLDSLRNVTPSPPPPPSPPRRALPGSERTIYIPHMADHSYAVAAAFEACGVSARVLPPSDERTLELGRRYTSGRECYPCALTTGDMLKLLMDEGVDPQKVAFFMPSGTGPCRFGQYHRLHRMILDELGYKDVPIYAPDQSEVLYEELGMVGGEDFVRLGWQGLVAVDMLTKALHETRPYELNPGQTDRVYQKWLARVCEAVRNRQELVEVMEAARAEFAAIPTSEESKPLVGIVGEIYTRANRFANEDVLRAVEELGGEGWMPTIAEWVLYTNYISLRRARIFRHWRQLMKTLLYDYFQHKDIHSLSSPWVGMLRTLEEPPIAEILNMARPYIDDSFEGEAVLSVGKSEDMFRKGVAGVINVIPFTCMPGNIVTAVMKRFREAHGGLPFITLAMDGQQQAANRIRLEAFMHQVRQFAAARGRVPATA